MSYLTEAEFIFKSEYTDDKLGEHTERDHVLFAMLAKKKGMGGADFKYPVRYGNPQGIGASFTAAQSAASTAKSKGVQFAAEPRLKYGLCKIDGPSLDRSEGNKAAFYELVTMEADGTLEELGDTHAFDAYRSGDGVRGRRLSASSNVITLYSSDQVRNFKPGMVIGADDTITGASARSGSAIVEAVDEDGATITLDNAAGITSFANDDYLFRYADLGGDTCVDGLEVLFPLTAPVYGSDNFRSEDRGRDVRRLAGCRVDDTASYAEENIGLLAVKISNNGKKADCAFINPINHWGICKRLNAKIEYDKGGRNADMYFQYIWIHTPSGPVKLYADPDCPTDRIFVGSVEWLFYRWVGMGAGDMIHQIKIGAGQGGMSWQASADGIEARFKSDCNLLHPLPGVWGVASHA